MPADPDARAPVPTTRRPRRRRRRLRPSVATLGTPLTPKVRRLGGKVRGTLREAMAPSLGLQRAAHGLATPAMPATPPRSEPANLRRWGARFDPPWREGNPPPPRGATPHGSPTATHDLRAAVAGRERRHESAPEHRGRAHVRAQRPQGIRRSDIRGLTTTTGGRRKMGAGVAPQRTVNGRFPYSQTPRAPVRPPLSQKDQSDSPPRGTPLFGPTYPRLPDRPPRTQGDATRRGHARGATSPFPSAPPQGP